MSLFKLLAIALISLTVSSCAAMTAKRTYHNTVIQFDSIVDTYVKAYDKASPEIQQQWKENIDPKILQVYTAIKLFGASLNSGTATESQLAELLQVKNEVIALIYAEIGGVK